MPKKKKKKPVKKKSGFFAKLFDLFTALLILGIAVGSGYYFIFYDSEETVEKEIIMSERELSVKELPEETVIQKFDPEADEEEMKRLHEYDPIIEQSEDYLEKITGGRQHDLTASTGVQSSFERSVEKWAYRYEGYRLKLGADPDKERATDNSHLMCAIWRNAAKDNGMHFSPGYMNTQDILKNVVPVSENKVKNGDLLILESGMIGMVVGFRSINDHSLVYASDNEKKVVVVEFDRMRHYWLKPENLKGYYSLKKELIN